jgi:hypothetical protein
MAMVGSSPLTVVTIVMMRIVARSRVLVCTKRRGCVVAILMVMDMYQLRSSLIILWRVGTAMTVTPRCIPVRRSMTRTCAVRTPTATVG